MRPGSDEQELAMCDIAAGTQGMAVEGQGV